MKRKIAHLLIMLFLLSAFMGCGAPTPTPLPPSEENASTQTPGINEQPENSEISDIADEPLTLYPGRIEMTPGVSVPILTNKTEGVTWQSSDSSIISVENGIATSVKTGDASITAAYKGESKTCRVIVQAEGDTLLYQSDTPDPDFSSGGGAGGDGAKGSPPLSDVPVKYDPKIPIEDLSKMGECVWEIIINHDLVKTEDVQGLPIDYHYTLNFQGLKSGGTHIGGEYVGSATLTMMVNEKLAGIVDIDINFESKANDFDFILDIFSEVNNGELDENLADFGISSSKDLLHEGALGRGFFPVDFIAPSGSGSGQGPTVGIGMGFAGGKDVHAGVYMEVFPSGTVRLMIFDGAGEIGPFIGKITRVPFMNS